MNDMIRTHPGELARALRNRRYEETDTGIVIAGAGVHIGGALQCRDYQDGSVQLAQIAANTLLVQGLAHLLNAGMPPSGGYTPVTQWYVAPWSTDYTPNGSETAATLPGVTGEFTNYTLGTRLPLVIAAATAIASVSTAEVLMTFNPAGGPFNVRGGSIVSNAVKSSTGGIALASAKLPNARLGMANGDKIGWAYVLTASDEG